jgi:limonene-1,2-epoxide hydrolase
VVGTIAQRGALTTPPCATDTTNPQNRREDMSNIERVRQFIDAFNRKDIDTVIGFFAEDAVYHNMPLEPIVGRTAIAASIVGYTTPASRLEWIMPNIAETASGTVLTERVDKFFMGAPGAEKWIALPVMGAFELKDGQITAWRDYFDLEQFNRQLA